MSVVEKQDLKAYCLETARRAKAASTELVTVTGAAKNNWLKESARRLRHSQADLIAANDRDLDAASDYGLTDAQIDRLRLTPERIEGIAVGLEEVAALPDPIGEVI
ncbi:MAG TPA: gamma-glutamyl-phosphate reductase, partial [Pirellulaceae bacterium]|nr:gamma-glutamyl-phosphate reductase [Pirellulaceae bacterium]